MSAQTGRYTAQNAPHVAEGWSLARLTRPSRLFGANGMRIGPDGRIYVAECVGSRVSAIDPDSGQTEVICPVGGNFVSPDDLDFDSNGDLYVTEYMKGRISIRGRDGRDRVLRDDLPGANGIVFYKDRLFVDECRLGGRVYELDRAGGAPRVLVEGLPLPNALAPGPDGYLYFPVIAANEIHRVHPDTGVTEKVIGGCHHPVAVKIDSQGFIISPQSQIGEVWRINPQSGVHTVIAKLDPCIDNLVFKNDRLFVSHLVDGRITEVLSGGKSREVLPGGLLFPLGMAVGSDGQLYFSDNCSFHVLTRDGSKKVGWMFGPGFPGTMRGVAAEKGDAFIVTTTDGRVVRYRPLAQENEELAKGFDYLCGAAVSSSGAILVAEKGAGRVLSIANGEGKAVATGLSDPMGVAFTSDGTALVSEVGAGRVVKINGSNTETVIDGLSHPEGIVVRGNTLYIVDAGAHAVIAYDMTTRAHTTLASTLPVGDPPGVTRHELPALPPFSGPLGPFAAIAAAADGTLYFSADTEGAVMALRPN
jgi:sugar lactone lactonase YvrE